VHCKLSGLLMPIVGFGFHQRDQRPSVAEVVDALEPHVRFGIETFGVDRCLFASNFPMDKVSVDYETLWDAFIEIATSMSLTAEQRAALLADNAAKFFRLVDPEPTPDA